MYVLVLILRFKQVINALSSGNVGLKASRQELNVSDSAASKTMMTFLFIAQLKNENTISILLDNILIVKLKGNLEKEKFIKRT